MIRLVLPQHLRTLAHLDGEVELPVTPGPDGAVTPRAIFDALEARYPALRGTIRDQATLKRRPMLRFYACEEDLSHEGMDVRLPDAVARGEQPLLVVGAIAGG